MTSGRMRRLENRVYRLIRHRTAFDAATAPPTDADLALSMTTDCCLLITYRRDGSAVPTPVWFAVTDGALVFESDSDAAKIKRLKRHPQVRVAPCTTRGRPIGPPVEAIARLLSGAQAQAAERSLADRYGARRRIAQRLRPRPPGHTYVELRAR